jgi:hypothetical protein
MSQRSDRRDLERQLEQAKRLVSEVTDQTTYQRLKTFVEELSKGLRRRIAPSREGVCKSVKHKRWFTF